MEPEQGEDGAFSCGQSRWSTAVAANATARIDLYQVPEPRRTQLLTQHRPESISLVHAVYGQAVIRDQKPLQATKLSQLLIDMTVRDWIQLLNSHVFFWLHPERLTRLLNARAYRDRPHLVLTVDTGSLLSVHADRVRLSHLNSGATAYVSGRRGSATFKPIADFQHPRSRRRPAKHIAELAVMGGVPDIAVHTIRVQRRQASQLLETLYLASGDTSAELGSRHHSQGSSTIHGQISCPLAQLPAWPWRAVRVCAARPPSDCPATPGPVGTDCGPREMHRPRGAPAARSVGWGAAGKLA